MKPRPPILAAVSSALILAVTTAGGVGENEADRYYNLKLGPIYITLNANLTTEYTDNVNLSSGLKDPILSDLIISPKIGMVALSELQLLPEDETNRTTLSVALDLGIRKHVFHPELDENLTNANIAPDSEISFLIHVGAVRIKLYDTFALENDPVADGSLSNVSEFRRFVNTIGANSQWNINSLTTARLDVMHRNLIALGLTKVGSSENTSNLNTNDLDSYTDGVSGSVFVTALSFLDLGMNASMQATTYPSAQEHNNTLLSYGPTAVIRFTDYTSLTANAGLTRSEENNDSLDNNADNGRTSTYGSLELRNKLNEYYTHSLAIGRQTTLDLLGTQNEVTYVRYMAAWRVNSLITLIGGLTAQDTAYVDGLRTSSNYQLLQGDLSTQFRLSRKLSTRLAYRYTDKIADDPTESYKQNQVTWELIYNF